MDNIGSLQKNTFIYPFRIDFGDIAALVYAHPGRQFCRWFKAYAQIPTNTTSQTFATDARKFLRIEQDWVSSETRPLVVFDATGFNRTYRDMLGLVEEGGMAMVYMPDEIDIAQDDWITPWGMVGDGTDAPSRTVLEVIPRGRKRLSAQGTVTIAGSTATFSSAVDGPRYGDVLFAAGGAYTIGTPVGATAPILGTITASPSGVTSAAYEIGRDSMLHPSAFNLIEIMSPAGTVYKANLLADIEDQEIRWIDISGFATSHAISVRYKTVPTYSVKSSWLRIPGMDYDNPNRPIGTLPHLATGMQVIPETHRGWQ